MRVMVVFLLGVVIFIVMECFGLVSDLWVRKVLCYVVVW